MFPISIAPARIAVATWGKAEAGEEAVVAEDAAKDGVEGLALAKKKAALRKRRFSRSRE